MKPKRLPRLWCALQGLLPLEDCLLAQSGELAWPRSGEHESDDISAAKRAEVKAKPRSPGLRGPRA